MAIFGRFRSAIRCLVACFVVGLAFFGGHLALLQVTGNFHTVIPGELYRSAQPSAAQLERYVHQYGIQTIINLRGSNDQPWYREEVAAAQRLGVEHIDFRMSATKVLTVEKATALIDIMKTAPRPILVHCMSGADRTGLFSLLYSYEVAGVPADVAERQLSVLFGHIGVPYLSASFAMERSWKDLEPQLVARQGG